VYDVAIIGGGPGGYAAALYAHNFGLDVALIERGTVGGTCLHRGCIPAKSWLHTAEVFRTVASAGSFGVTTSAPQVDWEMARVRKDKNVTQLVTGLQGLLQKRGVEVVPGFGRLALPGGVDVAHADGVTRRLEARAVILATGSVPRTIPGYPIDGERIVTSDHALDWPERPGRVAVIGAGAIGAEFASLLVDLGSEVHLFEIMDQVVPGADPAGARVLERALTRRGVHVRTSTGVGPAQIVPDGVIVPFGDEAVTVDVVLVAVGRAPVTEGIGVEATRIGLARGFVEVDRATMQTAEPGVYAVGDIVAGAPQLAHAAFAEGISAVTHIATGVAAPVDFAAIPLVVYSHPELASVGLTEQQARDAGHDVAVHQHSFAGVARAIIQGDNQGTVRIVSDASGRILGATVAGPLAGELIHELMYAVGWEALTSEAAAFVHAHPTVAEAVGEALLSAAGRSLH
jgi:dihydrolipoamide dehydrogenase